MVEIAPVIMLMAISTDRRSASSRLLCRSKTMAIGVQRRLTPRRVGRDRTDTKGIHRPRVSSRAPGMIRKPLCGIISIGELRCCGAPSGDDRELGPNLSMVSLEGMCCGIVDEINGAREGTVRYRRRPPREHPDLLVDRVNGPMSSLALGSLAGARPRP
jgi:hypothetical protein